MGTYRVMLLDLSVPASEADARLQEVRSWFRSSGWSRPDPAVHDWLYSKFPSDDRGPRLEALQLPAASSFAFTFIAGRDLYYLGDSTGGPECRRCGWAMDVLDAVPLVRNWEDFDEEPDIACPECRWFARMGDWDVSESFAVASFAVIIYQDAQTPDPWDVAGELLRALQQDLGGRWVLMHRHL